MNLEMTAARTGFPKCSDALRHFCGSRSEGYYVISGPKSAAKASWGTQVELDCVGETLANVSVGSWGPPDLQSERAVWGTTEDYGQAIYGPYLNLITVPSRAQGLYPNGTMDQPALPIARHGLVFGYTSQAPSVTGFLVNVGGESGYGVAPSSQCVLDSYRLWQDSAGPLTLSVKRTLALGELVEFDDGVEDEFAAELTRLVNDWGGLGVRKIAALISGPGVRTEVAAQTLLCLGRIDDRDSYQERSRALREGLASPSAKVRDAAAVGLASMMDVAAKADLGKAIEKETVPSLREDMREVLEFLRTVK